MTLYFTPPKDWLEPNPKELVFQCTSCTMYFTMDEYPENSSFCSPVCHQAFESDDEDLDYGITERRNDPGYIYDLTHFDGE